MSGISATPEWKALAEHAKTIKDQHLRDLLKDAGRSKALTKSFGSLYVDFSRQNATEETLSKLLALAETAKVTEKIKEMFEGVHLNTTENRAVLHVALRAARDATIVEDGKNVVPEVWKVRDKIAAFASKVRSGEWKGATGKPLTTAVAIGIGGSYLGPLFAHAALAHDSTAAAAAEGRDLRFLANVDPVDAVKALSGLDPETTLVVIVSKTFTTAETMRNARTARAWIVRALGADAVARHMVAVSTNLKAVEAFGIDPENAFGFWDWVGGRYSVTSAVGVLPLSLQYGTEVVDAFLEGAREVDEHYRTAPLADNVPALLGLFNVWNATFLGHPTVAVLPYQQALQHLAPHVQQLSMESNGKGVALDGSKLPYEAGEIVFGEPGTNGQHSFYQLVHQGRVVPAEFIGAAVSQQDVHLAGDSVTSHEELMANFFAQPDALAIGKTPEELRAQNVPEALVPHKTFQGNRPSLSILVPSVNASSLGQLLALYEHRVATSGFVWDINSFDQWGVELGKALATKVRNTVEAKRKDGAAVTEADGYNPSSVALLNKFLELSKRSGEAPLTDVFPPALA